jgi:hypothetical protein
MDHSRHAVDNDDDDDERGDGVLLEYKEEIFLSSEGIRPSLRGKSLAKIRKSMPCILE